jgi:uncharacterized membrane protein
MNAVGDLNLWAIGYDDSARAAAVRTELLDREHRHGLHVVDAVVATRLADGTFELRRDEPLSVAAGAAGYGALGFLVGLVVLQPVAAAAFAAVVGGATAWSARQFGVDDDFVAEVKGLVRPGTSALFLLTRSEGLDAVRHAIHGLGGTVLKTTVNAELARLAQESLDASRPTR